MRRLISVVLVLLASSSSLTAQQREIAIGITPDWFRFEDQDLGSLSGYVQFRRYAIVLNQNIDGLPTLSDLRNIMTFYCSIDPNVVSYVLIFVPREIDLSYFYGGQYHESREILVAFNEVGLVPAVGEVQDNQIFLDVNFWNREFFAALKDDLTTFLYLDERHRLIFRVITNELDSASSSIGYETFGDLVEGSIRGGIAGGTVSRASTADILDACR